MTNSIKIVREQGGSVLRLDSGASLSIAAGATISGAGTISLTGANTVAANTLTVTAASATSIGTAASTSTGDDSSGIMINFANGVNFYVGRINEVPVITASPGALFLRSDGSVSGLYINRSSGVSGSIWHSTCAVN